MGPVVAQRIHEPAPRGRRTWDERLIARFPRLYVSGARMGARWGPRSRLRQRFLRRGVISGYAAASRRDFDLMVLRYASDVVYDWAPDFRTLGLPARVEGRKDWIQSITEFQEVWEEQVFTPSFLLDAGERILVLGKFEVRGAASGIGSKREYAQVIEFRDGLIERESDYNDWSEGLRAAGFAPELRARLEAMAPGAVAELAGEQ